MKLKLIFISSLFFIIFACSNKDTDSPLIFAAASMYDVLTEIQKNYEDEYNRSIRFNFGGSNALAIQIKSYNAPADGVIFAGDESMRILLDDAVIMLKALSVVANNLLALAWVDNQNSLQVFGDLVSTKGKIAIADKDLSPAGLYAHQALESSGVFDKVIDRLVYLSDVRATLNTLYSGNTDYAFVYLSDLKNSNKKIGYILINQDYYDPINYNMAPVSSSNHFKDINMFFDYIYSKSGHEVFENHGFIIGAKK